MRLDSKTLLGAVGVALPILFGIFAGRLLSPWIPSFAAWVQTLGAWAPSAFVVAYVVVVLCMLPAFLLTMVGGAVFGVVQGTALVMTAALIGGTGAFLIARHAARDWVIARVARHPALATIDRAIGADGMRLVLLIRMSPAFPFVLTNYALGVTQVRLRDFVVGTLGFAPIVLTFAAFGSASGGAAQSGKPPVSPIVLGVGVSATVLLCVLLARITQRALREAEAARAVQE